MLACPWFAPAERSEIRKVVFSNAAGVLPEILKTG